MHVSLPVEWAKDRARRQEAGVPVGAKFRTRHQLALEMLDECGRAPPHSRVAGDDEMGRPSGFRGRLRDRGGRYLLGVPWNTPIRDLDVSPPEYSGGPRYPRSPLLRLDRRMAALPEETWTSIEVRDSDKGPLVVEVAKRRVRVRTETGGPGPEELLLVTRESQSGGKFKHDYSLSNADPGVSSNEPARAGQAAYRAEGSFRRAKSEAGLAEYQAGNWCGWHHHLHSAKTDGCHPARLITPASR